MLPDWLRHTGYCVRCGIQCEAQYCPDCLREMRTGQILRTDISLGELAEFVLEVWGQEMVDGLLLDDIENDPEVSFYSDSRRATENFSKREVLR